MLKRCPCSPVSYAQSRLIDFIQLNSSFRFVGSTYNEAYTFINNYHRVAQANYDAKRANACRGYSPKCGYCPRKCY